MPRATRRSVRRSRRRRSTFRKRGGAPPAGGFTDANTYLYIGHSGDIDVDRPEIPVPAGCLYANSEICGISTVRGNEVAQLWSFADRKSTMWRDPLNPVNNLEISKLLLYGASHAAGQQVNLLGLYADTFTDSIYSPLPKDGAPGKGDYNINWGRRIWGVISKAKAIELGQRFVNAVTAATTIKESKDFPEPGFYKEISYDKLKQLTLGMCTYPDKAAFDKYESNTGKLYTLSDGSKTTIRKTPGGPDVMLDIGGITVLKSYLDSKVSAIMTKYPGIHYNFMCRYVSKAKPVEVALRRWNSIRLKHHTLDQTLTESFYKDDSATFNETLNKILANNTLEGLYDKLHIVWTGRSEAQLAKYDGLEKFITKDSVLISGRNYTKAPESEKKLRNLRSAVCAKGKGAGCPAA